jgi:hypothetical protein
LTSQNKFIQKVTNKFFDGFQAAFFNKVLNYLSYLQGRREGGRGGNFYRGPDLKKGPKRAKFTSF